MKNLRKILSLAIGCCMMVSAFTLSASAAVEPVDGVDGVILNLGEPIGTLAEDEGVLLKGDFATRSSGLPFSMTANGVTGLLTTYSSSGKNFTGGAFDGLTGEGLSITGTLTHTLGYKIKVGACYYNSYNDTFYSVDPQYFNSGEDESGFIPKLDGQYQNFYNSTTYYGHITNYNGSGSVSGTLNFSVSTN